MRGKRCSDDLAAVIYRLHDSGKSVRCIASTIHQHKSFVQRVLERRVGNSLRQSQCKLGRPKSTTPRDDARMLTVVKLHRFATQREIGRQFEVSKDTVRRRLRQAGMKSRVALRDVLTNAHKRRRVAWCRVNRNTDFTTWLFSDECSFELADCSATSRAWVWRRDGERFLKCCVLKAPVSSRKKLMIWGCIASNGQSTIRVLRQNVNAHTYIATLRSNLLPLLDNLPLRLSANATFQQDNARPHTAGPTQQFLHRHGIVYARWPALSPDLNIIENVWSMLKNYVRKRSPQTLEDLEQAVLNGWRRIVKKKLCRTLYSSMRSRLARVIRRHGLR